MWAMHHEAEERGGRHVRIARRALRQVPDHLLGREGRGGDVMSADDRRATRGGEETADDLHGRGLSRAVGPEEAEHLALVDGERDAVHRDDGSEPFSQICNLDHGSHHTDTPETGAHFPCEQ